MKIRSDFVTNSSSSSYVILIDKEHFDLAKKEVHKLVADSMDKLFSESTIFGKEAMVASYVEADGWSWRDMEDISDIDKDILLDYIKEDLNEKGEENIEDMSEDDFYDYAHECLYEMPYTFKKKVRELGGDVHSFSEDC